MNWAFNVKQFLCNNGFGNFWTQQNFLLNNSNLIRQRIYDNFVQEWHDGINNSPKLNPLYCKIKNELKLESYLLNIKSKSLRAYITKFRISAHELNIEKGRYVNIPRENRKCNCCNMNVLENEYHFLLCCPLYYDLRTKYLPRKYCHWANFNKLCNILCSESPHLQIKLASYLYMSFQHRRSFLEL